MSLINYIYKFCIRVEVLVTSRSGNCNGKLMMLYQFFNVNYSVFLIQILWKDQVSLFFFL